MILLKLGNELVVARLLPSSRRSSTSSSTSNSSSSLVRPGPGSNGILLCTGSWWSRLGRWAGDGRLGPDHGLPGGAATQGPQPGGRTAQAVAQKVISWKSG